MALARSNKYIISLALAKKNKTNVGNGSYTKELLTMNTFLLKIKHNKSTKAKTVPKPTNPVHL